MKTQAMKPKVTLTAKAWWVIDKTRLQNGFNANIARLPIAVNTYSCANLEISLVFYDN